MNTLKKICKLRAAKALLFPLESSQPAPCALHLLPPQRTAKTISSDLGCDQFLLAGSHFIQSYLSMLSLKTNTPTWKTPQSERGSNCSSADMFVRWCWIIARQFTFSNLSPGPLSVSTALGQSCRHVVESSFKFALDLKSKSKNQNPMHVCVCAPLASVKQKFRNCRAMYHFLQAWSLHRQLSQTGLKATGWKVMWVFGGTPRDLRKAGFSVVHHTFWKSRHLKTTTEDLVH